MDGQRCGNYNQPLKKVLTANNVTLYSTENEEKSRVVERYKITMKNIMWKYFTADNTQKYIDVLSSMLEKYNNTYHRSIKLKPTRARKPANYKHIDNALNAELNARTATPPRFHVVDKVRILRRIGTFVKWFEPNWTEVFTITAVKATKPPTYTIEDTLGESVQGTFFEEELQLSVQEIYRIERVHKRGKDRVLVKGNGYSSAFNSWIPLAELEQL